MSKLSIALIAIIPFVSQIAHADLTPAKVITSKNSNCRIESSAGEYPMFKVFKGKELIYEPTSDGIVNGVISPNGRYAALAGGEVNLIEGFGIMIVNCSSGKRVGFLKGRSTRIKEWSKQKLVLEDGEISFAGKNSELLP